MSTLTPREQMIIKMLKDNPFSTNKQIGRKLHISEQTVKNELSHLFAKEGIDGSHKRQQLLKFYDV